MARHCVAIVGALFLASAAPAAEVAVGTRVANLTFKDIRYVARSLDDFKDATAFAIVFTDCGCPVVQRYLPTLNKLHSDYQSRGVVMLAVNVGPADTITAMAAQAVRHGCEFPFVKDFGAECAAALGATRTPEVVMLDRDRVLRYRGRIDDQFRTTGARSEPTRSDLREAIDAVLANKPVAVAQTPVDGCLITKPEVSKREGLTYAKDVAPLMRKHCQECHRPGTVAPFSLQNYQQVTSRAKAIAEVVTDGRMPPWHAAPEHQFTNRRALPEADRETILAWLRSADRPKGHDADMPAPLPPAAPWRIGEPDTVLSTSVYPIPETGDVKYQYAVLPTVFLFDTWVEGVEIRPSNPKVVHHCNMAWFRPGETFSAGNFITGQVPGGEAMALADGVAYKIPAGSVLGLQIHFVTTGKAESCRLDVGLKYARSTVTKQLRHMLLETKKYAIPPGAAAHPVSNSQTLDRDAIGIGLFSHMHLRGKDMTFTARLPDGTSETLLLIPNYSFDWQQPYRWPAGKRLPKGTTIECVAHYDNSAFNPFNPDPKATVRDGPQTYHEMMNGFVFYVAADEDLKLKVDPKTGRAKP